MKHKAFVDFGDVIGKIKPMHGTNCGPRQIGGMLPLDMTREFSEIGIPFCRLHDVEYPYGHGQFVDIHCIFPNFDADVEDESSYNFEPTDVYLKGIIDSGGKVFYRLGESIDHFPKKLFIHPPKDSLKWAKICEHIIRHYNEGWANGFHYGIEYWEIWNEPDNDKMWTGTKEQFFELYRVTANHLKSCFGDTIKVGGCAFSGFYVLNRENPTEWAKTLVPYMHDFLKFITDEKSKAPMDFFSWHCYAKSPEEVALHSKYADDIMKQYGLENCESILNEFNMEYCFTCFTAHRKGSFADMAASLILAQKSNIDLLMHYGICSNSTYNNLLAVDVDGKTILRYAAFQSFKDFGSLYRLGSEVATTGDIQGSLNILAAKNDTNGGIMIVARNFEGELEIEINGSYKKYSVKCTDDESEKGFENVVLSEEKEIADGKITLNVKKHRVLYITLK